MKMNYMRRAKIMGTLLLVSWLLSQLPAANKNAANILWCGLSLVVIRLLPQPHLPGALQLREQVTGFAMACGVFSLAIRFCVGVLLQEMAGSPYDLSPRGIVLNLWNLFPFLVACEVLRAYMIGAAYNETRRWRLWAAGLSLVLGLMQLNLFRIYSLKDAEQYFVYAAKVVLPVIAQSYLLTALVTGGGVRSAVLYAGLTGGFLYVFPFLPDLPWLAESAVGIAFPVMAALYIGGKNQRLAAATQETNQESVVGSGILMVFSVAFMWFVVGVFPVYPSVVLTGSMEPDIMPGDVVLIEKFKNEQEIYALAPTDIINFQRGDIVITHRIMEVLYDQDGNISFRTKGDNNNTVDVQTVSPNDVRGIVRKTIPRAGLPVFWMRSKTPLPEGVVDVEDEKKG